MGGEGAASRNMLHAWKIIDSHNCVAIMNLLINFCSCKMLKYITRFLFLIIWFRNIYCEVYDDRPKIKTSNGDLVLVPAYDKNIYLRGNGPNSKVFIANIDITRLNISTVNQERQPEISTNVDYADHLNGRYGILRRLRNLEYDLRNPTEISNNLTAIWNKLNRLQTQVTNIRNQFRNNVIKDKCASHPCINGGTCLNLGTQYHCLCPSNWKGRNCDIDVNECRNFAGTDLGCQNGAICINKPGSYECQCRTGWYGLHCTRKAKDCSGGDLEMCGHGTCIPISTGQGIKCICDQGWTTNGTGYACDVDINECESAQGPHCSVNPKVACVNLPGSFRCGSCPIGYEGDGYVCSDIDECTTIPNGGCSSSPIVPCYNTIGSRICGPCPAGYEGDGVTCSWRGSCSINRGGCHPSAQCIENFGSQITMCVCPEGMEGDGVGLSGCYVSTNTNSTLHCENNPCGSHGKCHPLPRAYTCFCDKGYGGAHCETTMDFCSNNPCNNGGTCRQDDSTARGFRCECTSQYSGPLCQSHARICGDMLYSEEGSIVYPLSNSTTYNHNSRCAWVIHTSLNKVINVTFTKFDIEFIQDCAYDFLQIHDGRTSASQLIGRFCGTDFPKGGNIISSHNNLYFWFRSDQTIAKDGFALHWTSTDPVCGGKIKIDSHGYINSPGWPGKYPRNRNCYWHLTATLGKRIQLHFFQLDIEAHANCSYDYLAIYDGDVTTDPLLNKYCNTSQPAPIQSAGSEILIHFHSDALSSGNGFQISYATVDGVPGCGGLYSLEKGEITSPSYNGKYLNNLLCDYQIKTSINTKIKITFQFFEIERSFRCQYDYLKIYDGLSSDAKLVGKFCGKTYPNTYLSSSNVINLRFKSDRTMTKGGFKISYESICQQTLTGDSGILTSPRYPHSYPADRVCEYVIIATPGKAIQLTFQDLDIEDNSNNNCTLDYIEMRDGPDMNSTLLGRYCGKHLPLPQTSTHNYMYVKFKSDLSISGTGFSANFSTIETKCGGIHKEDTGLINYPLLSNTPYYDNDETCIWMLVAAPGYHIKLTWNKFDIEDMPSCLSDYLELTEIDDNNESNSLGRYCGSTAPPSLTTSTSRLKIKFISDVSTTSSGFSFSYSFLNEKTHCGGLYIKSNGYLYSPGWPKSYEPNRDCIWTIVVDSGQQIQLNISEFDIESSIRNKCNYGDYLEIRNGANQNSPLIGKFCGTTIPRRITSMTNSLYLHFHSDFYLGGKGFKIEWDGTVSGCGGTITGHTGSIASPNYPQQYGVNAECFYKIVTNLGSRIKIRFIDLDLERSIRCREDYVEIFDGRDNSANSLGRYCSMSTTTFDIETSSNIAMIKFRSDVLIGGKGFFINYYTICNQNLTGSYGVIESPNYPNVYDGVNCLWTITVPKGNRINITFTHFDIYKPYRPWFGVRSKSYSLRGCTDFVQLRDGLGGEFNNKLCGNVLPDRIVSKNNILQIKFETAKALFPMSTGFRLEWVKDGCGGHIIKDFGIITFPSYIISSNGPFECEWQIETSPGSAVKITFSNIYNIKETPNCTDDVIELYDGQNLQSPLMTKICQRGHSSYQSTTNLMLIRFVKKSDYRDSSIIGVFETVQAKCGGRLHSLSGSIYSPNYPKNYDNNMDCIWYIWVPLNHLISLNMIDVDLYSTNDYNACDDSIKIFDNNNIFANYSQKICANTPTTQIISKSNSLSIQFITNSVGTAKGFKANFSMTCGARIEVKTSGVLTNNDITYYPSNQSCVWTLMAVKTEQKISLTITFISLPIDTDVVSSKHCHSSFLRVLDGNDNQAPIIGEYCGHKVPSMIVSRGNALTIELGSYSGIVRGKFSAHYSAIEAACGGTLTSEEGSFTSPNYPYTYPSSTNCEWTLSTSPGNRVYLTFEAFNIEYSENCNADYVEVREKNGAGRLIGVYCGDEIPTNTTIAAQLYIKFHSDDKAINQGFLAHYGFIHGNEFTELDKGEIASPLYPHVYEGPGEYTWRITNNNRNAIVITINQLQIISRNSYCSNSLIIYDGYDETGPLLEELCGLLDYNNKKVLKTSSSAAFFKFKLDETNTGSLFYLQWSTSDTSITDEDKEKINCGSNTTIFLNVSDEVDIKHPSYGNAENYGSHCNCEWIYRTSPGAHFKIFFLKMDLEQYSDCNADYVSIFSSSTGGGDWKPVKEHLCSSDIGSVEVNDTNFMKVIFKTDASVEYEGFHGIVRAMCGGLIKSSSGIINVPWSCWNGTRVLIEYEWKIKVRQGRTINVHFDSFNITNKNDYCNTYVMLRNGESEESPILGTGKYCGYSHESREALTTSSNSFYVKYYSTSHVYQTFSIRFEELNVECGLTSTLDNDHTWEVINSPNYPSVPVPYSECVWVFTGPPGEILRIDFIDRFDLEWNSECMKESVEIRDGATEYSPLKGNFCQGKPSTVKTTGNIVYIKYFTQLTDPRNGFKANISIDVCGGTIHARHGEITSPGYPHMQNLPVGTVCEWKIIGFTGNVFQIKPQDISLPASQNHCGTKVTIEEIIPVNKTTSILETFCESYSGQSTSSAIQTFTNEVIIKLFIGRLSEMQQLSYYRGFRFKFSSTFPTCGDTIMAPEGYITTPNYPRETNLRYCNWLITAPDSNRRIRLELLDSDFTNDKVKLGIYNDHSFQTPIKSGADDWSNTERVFESSGNKLGIYLWLAPLSSHQRFKAKYSSNDLSLCGGELLDTSTELSSPNLNRSYVCEWHLVNQPSKDLVVDRYETMYINVKVNTSSTKNRCRFSQPRFSIKAKIMREISFDRDLCGNTEMSYRIPARNIVFKALKGRTSFLYFQVNWKKQPCGGIVAVGEQFVDILKLPADNIESLDCAWIIQVPSRSRIEMQLQGSFSLDCSQDFLKIHHGLSERDVIIGDYCKDRMPSNSILVHFRTVYVDYHSSQYKNNTNLKLMVKTASSPCGGLLTNILDSTFTSPNYPKSYIENQECSWEIVTDVGNRISLKFIERFVVEDTLNCTKDAVIIYDWKDEKYVEIEKLCGRQIPHDFNSTNNKMKIIFRTNAEINLDGFKAYWKNICGGNYIANEKEQFLYSPGYPNEYPIQQNCYYHINASSTSKIILTFLDFDIEGEYPKCKNDNVTITAQSAYDYQTSVYCGKKYPPILKDFDSIDILFHSDIIYQKKGFKVSYQTSNCNKKIMEPTVLSIGDNNNNYDNNLNCTWLIEGPKNKIVVIKFLYIDIEENSECTTDYLAAYEGTSIMMERRIALICGHNSINDSTTTIKSKGSTVLLQFVSDFALSYSGFKAEVFFSYSKEYGCGGDIELSSLLKKTLKSPFIGNNYTYDPFLDCHWLVTAPKDKVIHIEFRSFHVSPCRNVNQTALGYNNCHCDYVEIQDGFNPDSILIGKFCGHNIPQKLISSGNTLSIKLHTDGEIESPGFEVTFSVHESECGSTHFYLNSSVQRITSPGYNYGKIPRGIHCSYFVFSSEDKLVNIKIKNLDILPENENNICDKDKLVIGGARTMDNQTFGPNFKLQMQRYPIFQQSYAIYFSSEIKVPQYYTYCGQKNYIDLYTNGNLMVKIQTSAQPSTNTYKGFEVEVSYTVLCSRNYTGSQGRIQFTNNEIKDDLLDCYTLITAPENHTISLYIFNIIINYWSETISRLTFLDGNTKESSVLYSISRDTTEDNMPIFSTGRHLLIHNHGTKEDSNGFDANYVTSNKGRGCGGKINNIVGVVTSPMYPNVYRKVSTCEWEIESPSGTNLLLHFKFFDLGIACDQNYIQIINKKGEEFSKYCAETPADYRSPDNYVKLVFKTSMNNGGKGWIAEFLSTV